MKPFVSPRRIDKPPAGAAMIVAAANTTDDATQPAQSNVDGGADIENDASAGGGGGGGSGVDPRDVPPTPPSDSFDMDAAIEHEAALMTEMHANSEPEIAFVPAATATAAPATAVGLAPPLPPLLAATMHDADEIASPISPVAAAASTVKPKPHQPASAGAKWTPALDAELLSLYVDKKMTVKALADHFGRTRGAITSRLEKVAGDRNNAPFATPPSSSSSSSAAAAAIGVSASPASGAPLADVDHELGDEQRAVLAAVRAGQSVFFTGAAGSGKSYLLTKIVRSLRETRSRATYITASTGMAAVNIGGTTIHSFAGVGFGDEPVHTLVGKIKRNRNAVQRWATAQRLIVDEISMISADLWDKLEQIAREIRKSDKPFGGIQLILCGDFFQLPPVKADRLCFQATSWNKCMDAQIELTRVYRQTDTPLVSMLNELRRGICTPETTRLILATKNRPIDTSDGIRPTKLYSHKGNVEAENLRSLQELKQKPFDFDARDTGTKQFTDQLASHCPAASRVTLKVGAQVLLLKNIDQKNGLVNGSRGVVTDFAQPDPPPADGSTEDIFPIVKFASGREIVVEREEWSMMIGEKTLAKREQIPLALAWSMTIHKCQGMTLDRAELSLSECFEYGQAYVGISRIRSLDTCRVLSFDPTKVKAHPAVVQFYQNFKSQAATILQLLSPNPTPTASASSSSHAAAAANSFDVKTASPAMLSALSFNSNGTTAAAKSVSDSFIPASSVPKGPAPSSSSSSSSSSSAASMPTRSLPSFITDSKKRGRNNSVTKVVPFARKQLRIRTPEEIRLANATIAASSPDLVSNEAALNKLTKFAFNAESVGVKRDPPKPSPPLAAAFAGAAVAPPLDRSAIPASIAPVPVPEPLPAPTGSAATTTAAVSTALATNTRPFLPFRQTPTLISRSSPKKPPSMAAVASASAASTATASMNTPPTAPQPQPPQAPVPLPPASQAKVYSAVTSPPIPPPPQPLAPPANTLTSLPFSRVAVSAANGNGNGNGNGIASLSGKCSLGASFGQTLGVANKSAKAVIPTALVATKPTVVGAATSIPAAKAAIPVIAPARALTPPSAVAVATPTAAMTTSCSQPSAVAGASPSPPSAPLSQPLADITPSGAAPAALNAQLQARIAENRRQALARLAAKKAGQQEPTAGASHAARS